VFGRRLLVLLVILSAIGIPAAVLRTTCAGRSCSVADVSTVRVPFCPLPAPLKADLVAGYRQGRSPDVLAVTRTTSLWGGTDPSGGLEAAWPSVSGAPVTAVPILFSRTGVSPLASLAPRVGLDQIAPTLADVLGFRRPHPNVRAGTPVAGLASGERPRLVLEIAWKGIGSRNLRAHPRAWPFLRSLMRTGAGTLQGDTGSLPLDAAATLTTIGTGGLPSQHGITGTLLRNDKGDLVRAWGPGAPLSVIATLPDDLDQSMDQKPMIGLVATDTADRGIIGGNWYLGHDRDRVVVARGPQTVAAAERLLAIGFGRDSVPDVLAVVLDGPVRSMDERTQRLIAAASRASGGSVVVAVMGTGTNRPSERGAEAVLSNLVSQIDAAFPGKPQLVAGVVPGGLFLDQSVLADLGVSGDAAVQALLGVVGPDGRAVVEDAFQGFAVSFARYC
jgi:hypothetical protein